MIRLIVCLVLAVVLSGCATAGNIQTEPEPYRPITVIKYAPDGTEISRTKATPEEATRMTYKSSSHMSKEDKEWTGNYLRKAMDDN